MPDICQKFIQEADWTYAKTMPQSPHYYVVRTPENDEAFATFAEFIQQQGFPARFGDGGQEYTYLEEDGYLYWTMGNPVPETTIINRCSASLYDKIQTQDGMVLRRDSFFAKGLTKMQLESTAICIIPGRLPQPGDEVMQRLTLNQKGHVWLTRYECCGEDWIDDQKLTEKTQFQLSSYVTREVFALIKEVFSGDYKAEEYVDDHAPWYLVLTNEDGERWSTEGSPVSTKLKTKKGPLSAVLRELLGRQDLFLFEDHPGS